MALAGLGAAATHAQQRVGSDGRALDANNRIGSGGLNQPGVQNPYGGNAGNLIVTGNVTGGREFRGIVPYSDPFAFRGNVAGLQTDQFIRQSSGITTGGVSNFNAQQVQPFFGDARAVAPPTGFVQQSPSGGYVPAPNLTREPGDFRLGVAAPGTNALTLPQPGQLVLPGPVDPSTQNPTVITASPLYGVRQWDATRDTDQSFLQGLNDVTPTRLDRATLERMQRELDQENGTDTQQGGDTQNPQGRTEDPANRNLANGLSLGNSLESPENRPLNSNVQNQNLSRGSELSASPIGATAQRQRLLAPPERQSTQIAELQRRLRRYEQEQLPGAEVEQANRDRQREQREKQEKQAKGPGGTTPDQQQTQQPGQTPGQTAPGAPGAPGTPGQAQAPGANKPESVIPDYARRSKDILEGKDTTATDKEQQQPKPIPGSLRPTGPAKEKPLVVSSLATGVQAKSLKDFLTEAENQMKQGKYNAALEQYEAAEMVAPNNPMIALGRANAELGVGYYGRAEGHLREAFTRDPALLMAQYDLKSFLGNERLEFLVKDLKEAANQEKNEPRQVFLLSYIMYNTGNERMASAYLDLAEKRAGKPDPLYPMLRKYWALPSGDAQPAEGVNK
jgi:tetratricopeptide (TPR) repeat protein